MCCVPSHKKQWMEQGIATVQQTAYWVCDLYIYTDTDTDIYICACVQVYDHICARLHGNYSHIDVNNVEETP